ncbi:Fc.00g027410.m01.CDS01 [Cosmosporella sp. VM-42]
MGSDNQTAVVALVVSLVALLVSLGQLLQMFFSTAEGYRRCAESVMGVWHKTRTRRFRFYEMRFETMFTTPEIILLSSTERYEAAQDYTDVYLLQSPGNKGGHFILETVHPQRPNMVAGWSLAMLRGPRERSAKIAQPPYQMEMSVRKGSRTDMLQHRRRKRRSPASGNEVLVTWILLLEELHNLYSQYWPGECGMCQKIDEATHPPESSTRGTAIPFQNHDPHGGRHDVAIIYRRWSWDFMPPDVTRPLAKTTIGDILVLALRMGMRWRILQPESGRMQADGEGYSLSATQVNSMGIVMRFMRFTALGRHSPQQLIPSTIVDKLLCGIIAGDNEFVKREFNMIGNNGERRKIHDSGGVLDQIGFLQADLALAREKDYIETTNETVMLLLPFLPLRGSSMVGFRYTFYHPRSSHKAVFHFWEGKLALLRVLESRLQTQLEGQWAYDRLAMIHDQLATFARDYYNDFYNIHFKEVVRDWTVDGKSLKDRFVAHCRGVFDFANSILREPGLEFHQPSAIGQPRYLYLIAAHARMGLGAIGEAIQVTNDSGGKDVREEYDVPQEPRSFAMEVYEVVRAYARYIHHPVYGINVYLNSVGIRLTKEQAEVAWWALMLRGVAWRMAIWQYDWEGDAIPSSLSGNKTPVWIT